MSDRQGKKLPFAGWTEFSTALMELARGDADKNKPTEEDKRGS